MQPRTSQVVDELWRTGSDERGVDVFALLDGARGLHIRQMVRGLDSAPLYDCSARGTLDHVAPYLVRLDRNAGSTRNLIEKAWGRSWGVFLRSPAFLHDLRRHLFGLFVVQTEAGRKLYFRFFDPRVLRVYLPTCTAEQRSQVFGPVSRFLVEDAGGGAVLGFAPDGTATSTALGQQAEHAGS